MAKYLKLHDYLADGIESDNPHDYVICPLCGRKFKYLGCKHLGKYHNMRTTEFKALYPDAKMLSDQYIEERHERISKQQKDFLDNLRTDPEKFQDYMQNIKHGGGRKHKVKRSYKDYDFKVRDSKNIDINEPDSYVTCPLCNKKFSKILEYHLKNIHDMTMDEFKEKYPEHPIQSKRCTENVLASRRNFWKNLSPEERSKYVKQALDNMGNKNLVTTLSDGKTYRFKANWEIYIAQFFIDNGIEFEFEKEFPYTDASGKQHTYFADWTLLKYNLVIETKGRVWLEINDEINKLKEKAVIKQGYDFVYLMYGKKNKVLKDLRNILDSRNIK